MPKNVFIIAEAGVNHNGSINTAKRMIDIAVAAGVDAIKFQIFKTEDLILENTPKAGYQNKNTKNNETQFAMLERLELNRLEFKILNAYCKGKGIIFLASAFDAGSIDFLNELGLKIFKIPSGEITNFPYLRKVGSLKKEVILSTGMSTLAEIKQALEILLKAGTKKADITVLHCVTDYPTRFCDVNLRSMPMIHEKLGIKVGYSDHTEGIEAAIAAVALGAGVIEKHFTVDKEMKGPDHRASLDSAELKQMVLAIRNTEIALGQYCKKPTKTELKNRLLIRKSIVAAKTINKGEFFTEENMTVKRPGIGISPLKWQMLIGKKSARSFKKNDLIRL